MCGTILSIASCHMPPHPLFSQLLHTSSGKILYIVIIIENENVETGMQKPGMSKLTISQCGEEG